jgi:hypothetical protein
MPISPHLHRKLREVLGADAGDDLVDLLEEAKAARGDIAELRHQMELRFSAIDGKFSTLKAELEGSFTGSVAKLEATLEKALKDQMRFFFLAWAVLLAAIVGIYTR